MRKTLAFFYLLVIAGFACIAHAQLTQTGAGKFGSGGGATFPCAGTHLGLTNNDDLRTGWSTIASSVAWDGASFQDPIGGNNASSITSTAATFPLIRQAIATPWLAATGVSAVTAYFKTISGPTWIAITVDDGSANAARAWYNLGSGTVGTISFAGTGVSDCATMTGAANGYFQTSFAFHVTANTSGLLYTVYLAAGDNQTAGPIGQQIYAWHVGS